MPSGDASSGKATPMIAAKTAAAYRNRLTPILCVGELRRGTAAAAVKECLAQLDSALTMSVRRRRRDRWSSPTSRSGRSAQPSRPPRTTSPRCAARCAAHLDSMPQFAGSQVIYGGSAGPGLFTELKAGVDGLFLGRFAHDPAAVELILDETVANFGPLAGTHGRQGKP